MKAAILGARGMLGRDVMSACDRGGIEAVGFDLPELDITSYEDVTNKVPDCDWVINCAAYTRVDDAESEQDAADAVNREGAGHVARICARRGARLLHVSTDYVFDGSAGRPYDEDDPTCPLSVYGSSKLAGERAVQAEVGNSLIVRTESLFGLHGSSFVRAIMDKIEAGGDNITVVNDQITAPTYTPHLAAAMLALMNCDQTGVVHVCASGQCTWFEFAEAIAKGMGVEGVITPISTGELAMVASRPAYSVLDTTRYSELTGETMPTWREGLEGYLNEASGS